MSYKYNDDRSYTDNVHNNLAVKIIYEQMGWKPYNVNNDLAVLQDSEYSIDYHAMDKLGNNILIQERFRRPGKTNFDDFTLRYEREDNPEEIEQKSEFFKMKGKLKRFSEPFFMVYGIVNSSMDGFAKYAVLNLRAFFKHYNNKEIVIDPNSRKAFIENETLHCGLNRNADNSSSFICVSIPDLLKLFDDVVVYQEGFVTQKTGDATEKQIEFVKALAERHGFSLQNEEFLSKADVSSLIALLKDERKITALQDLFCDGDMHVAAMFLSWNVW